MIQRILSSLDGRSPGFVVLVAFILIGFVGIIDWATGPVLVFAVFYLVPVSMAAWRLTARSAVAVAALCAVVSLAAETAAGLRFEGMLVPIWNTWARLGSFLIVVALLVHVRRLLDHEKELSRTDFLTEVSNRRAFREAVDRELKRVERWPRPLTIVYLDVDRFKEINDRFGHSGGDRVLKSVAKALREHTRATDVVARLGGDEFGLLLPETDGEGATKLIESLSERIATEVGWLGFPVTFSAGAVTFTSPPAGADEMIRLADEKMYEAKRSAAGHILTHS